MNSPDSGKNETAAPPSSTVTAVLVVSFLASFLTPFMISSVNVALPAIGKEFRLSGSVLGWITTAYLLCSTVLLIPFGKLADTLGRKRFFANGIAVTTIAAILSAAAPNGYFLIAARVIHGIGAAMVFGTGMAMLTSVVPAKSRGKMIGINVSCTYLGLTMGPALGGMFVSQFGWRSIFIITIPIGFFIYSITRTRVAKEWIDTQGETFDTAGSILYAAAFSCIIIGMSSITHIPGKLFTVAGIVLTILFIMIETRATYPILPLYLFRSNRLFACSTFAAFCNYSATYAVGFLMSLYLQYVKGMVPNHAGFILMVQPIIMVLMSPVAGRLSDRIESRILASLGMGSITVALVLLSGIDAATPLRFIIMSMILMGGGFAFFSSPNTSAVMGSVDKQFYGVASATVGTMRLMGQVISMGSIMVLMSVMLGAVHLSPESAPLFVAMMHRALLIFSLVSFCGIAVSLVRGSVRPV